MLIDFNTLQEMTFPGMNNGTGMMTARMFNNDNYRIIPTKVHPGGSIGEHTQDSGDDLNYSIINTGDDDLVMLTIVVKKGTLYIERSSYTPAHLDDYR